MIHSYMSKYLLSIEMFSDGHSHGRWWCYWDTSTCDQVGFHYAGPIFLAFFPKKKKAFCFVIRLRHSTVVVEIPSKELSPQKTTISQLKGLYCWSSNNLSPEEFRKNYLSHGKFLKKTLCLEKFWRRLLVEETSVKRLLVLGNLRKRPLVLESSEKGLIYSGFIPRQLFWIYYCCLSLEHDRSTTKMLVLGQSETVVSS